MPGDDPPLDAETDSPLGLQSDHMGYDPTVETYHARHDWGGEVPLTTSVVEAITTVTDEDPAAVEPLYDSLDPDALEGVLRSLRASGHGPGGTVHFTFHGRDVDVGADGTICVYCESDDLPSD